MGKLTSTSIAIYASLAGIIAKLVFFYSGMNNEFSIYSYLLVFMISIFLGIKRKQNSLENSFGQLFKEGLRVGLVITILISAFTYVYYKNIDPQFFESQIEQRVSEALDVGYTDKQIDQIRANAEAVFAPFTHSTLTLVGFMVVSIMYSLVTSLIVTKIPTFRNL